MSQPTVVKTTTTAPDTEHSIVIPAGVGQANLWNRGAHAIQWSWKTGQTNVAFNVVPAFSKIPIDVPKAGGTLYFQAKVTGDALEAHVF